LAVNTGVGTADSFAHLPKKQHPHLTVHDVGEPARLRPIASMLTRTSPAPGSPTSSDSNRRTSDPPNSWNLTTFVFISAYLPLRSFPALLVFMDFVSVHYRRGGLKLQTLRRSKPPERSASSEQLVLLGKCEREVYIGSHGIHRQVRTMSEARMP
jgi:hypothetical protein